MPTHTLNARLGSLRHDEPGTGRTGERSDILPLPQERDLVKLGGNCRDEQVNKLAIRMGRKDSEASFQNGRWTARSSQSKELFMGSHIINSLFDVDALTVSSYERTRQASTSSVARASIQHERFRFLSFDMQGISIRVSSKRYGSYRPDWSTSETFHLSHVAAKDKAGGLYSRRP